ncbi:MAG TPA: PAS domain S-box protein, partial [Chroococcidiopsis sp.]
MSSNSLGHASESTPRERLQVQKQPLADDDIEEHGAFAEAALAMILADADQAIALLSKDLNVIRYSQSLLRLWRLSPHWLDQQPCLSSLLNELVALNYWSESAKSELLKQLHAPLPTTRQVTLTITQQDGTVLDLRMRQMQAGQWVLIINRAASSYLGNPNLGVHPLDLNPGIHHTVRHSTEWPQSLIMTEGGDRPTATPATDTTDATDATDATDVRYPSHASEASYRDIVEEQTELIGRFLPDNTVTFVNEAFCRYFGVSREEVIGKSFDPVIHEDDRARVRQLVQSLSPENPILLIENRVLVNGQVRWTQWIDRMLYDDQGNAVECQAVGRDITKLKTLEDMLRLTNQELALMIETQSAKLKDAIDQLKAETIQREQTNAALMESEVRYRSVVAALQEGVILQDAEHRILTCNASAERILGMTIEQCQGRSFSELALFVIQKDGSPFPKDQYPTRVTLNTGEPCSEVIMGFVRNPSEVCWLRVNTQPLIHEGETQPYAVVISFINITKRLQVEERLRLLESVVVNAKDSIVITDASPLEADGPHILYVNDSFTRLTGYSPEEVIGKNPRLLQGDRTDKATLQTIHTALAAREPVMVEIVNYTKDRREFWTELSIAPIMDERGTHTHWIAIQRDITQR